jgi:hypothetical protein
MISAVYNQGYSLIPTLRSSVGVSLSLSCYFFYYKTLQKNQLQGSQQGFQATDLSKKRSVPSLSHMVSDLIRKVACATAFYFTTHLSFYCLAKNLLSPSEKISGIVLPVLKKMAETPLPRFLPPAYLIACAPALAKLIQMILIYKDPQGENQTLEAIKTYAGKASYYLECLWHIRLALLQLGASRTVYATAMSVAVMQAIYLSIPDDNQMVALIGFIPFMLIFDRFNLVDYMPTDACFSCFCLLKFSIDFKSYDIIPIPIKNFICGQ